MIVSLQEGKLVCGGGAGTLAVLAVDTDLAADPKTLKKFPTGAEGVGLTLLRCICYSRLCST